MQTGGTAEDATHALLPGADAQAAPLYYEQEATQADVAERLGVSSRRPSAACSRRRAGRASCASRWSRRSSRTLGPGRELRRGARARPGAPRPARRAAPRRGARPGAGGGAARRAAGARRRAARLVRADDLGGGAGGAARSLPGRRARTDGRRPGRAGGLVRAERDHAAGRRARGRRRRRSSTRPRSPASTSTRRCSRIPRRASVLELWATASCVILGVGARRSRRARGSRASCLRRRTTSARRSGDICSRFYDGRGDAVPFPGSSA